ncbi:MAG: hypothetical protein B7Z80_25045 [Rhodospirillales bacterium 20-64-7]|nr:MAG: hypothetical protein B7Z80_25045 [Rhodospirillales bacterium 20-64-7]
MRAVLKFSLSFLVILAVVWLGLWWYAQGRIASGFQAWAETQAVNGLKVSYSSLQTGTSPLAAVVTINNLVLTLPPTPNGDTGTITLPTLALRINAANPTIFHTDLPSKIAVAIDNNIDASINTGSIAMNETLDPNALFSKTAYPFRSGDLNATDIDILASQGSLLVMHIDRVTGHSDLNLNADANSAAATGSTTFDGIALSPILTRIASIPFDGKITHLSMGLSLSGPVPPNLMDLVNQLRAAQADPVAEQKLLIPLVHKWATAGGNGNMNLALTIGPAAAAADAAIKFDANLQPEGTADLTAIHLHAFTSAITDAYPQFQPSVAAAEALLSPYLTTSPSDGQTLAMHATYGAGMVNLNGNKVADMPPLDWNALENPTTAPATPTGQVP